MILKVVTHLFSFSVVMRLIQTSLLIDETLVQLETHCSLIYLIFFFLFLLFLQSVLRSSPILANQFRGEDRQYMRVPTSACINDDTSIVPRWVVLYFIHVLLYDHIFPVVPTVNKNQPRRNKSQERQE
jgi:hypothetical protein